MHTYPQILPSLSVDFPESPSILPGPWSHVKTFKIKLPSFIGGGQKATFSPKIEDFHWRGVGGRQIVAEKP